MPIIPAVYRIGTYIKSFFKGDGVQMEGGTSGVVGIKPPAVITDYELTLPAAGPAEGDMMVFTAAGVGSFTSGTGPQGAQGGIGPVSGPQGSQGTQGFIGWQGPQGIVGVQGTQGFQGIQGLIGTVGYIGVQGTQGIQGLQGYQGVQGSQGSQGEVGYFGPQGPGPQGWQGQAGSPSAFPTGIQSVIGPQTTTSSTFVDIPGLSTTVTLVGSAPIQGLLTSNFQEIASGGSTDITAGFRVVIDATNGDEVQQTIHGENLDYSIAAQAMSGLLVPGTYTIKGQYRVVSGTKTLSLDQTTLQAMGLEGSIGPQGRQGIQGIQGWQGSAGGAGSAGAQGNQGWQGWQGYGAQGAQGATGAGGGGGATTALDNLASVAINTGLVSDTDNTDDLGTAAKRWKDIYPVAVKVLASASDANPTAQVSTGSFALGAGGASAVDVEIKRSTTSYGGVGHLWMPDFVGYGNSHANVAHYGGSYGGTVGIITYDRFSNTLFACTEGEPPAFPSHGLRVPATKPIYFDNVDTYLVKSAASGGNFSYFYDGAEIIRDDGTNYVVLASRGVGLHTAIGDANPTVKMISGGLTFGAGGASAVDVQLSRTAANVLALGTGDFFRFQGGTSGYVEIQPQATITSYTLKLPTAKGGAASTLWFDGTDTLAFEECAWTALTSAATVTVDVAAFGKVAQLSLTLAGNVTLGNPTNAKDGQKITFRIKQSAGGGNTVAFDTKYRFGSTLSGFTMSSSANKVDYLLCQYNSTDDKWDVLSAMQGY